MPEGIPTSVDGSPIIPVRHIRIAYPVIVIQGEGTILQSNAVQELKLFILNLIGIGIIYTEEDISTFSGMDMEIISPVLEDLQKSELIEIKVPESSGMEFNRSPYSLTQRGIHGKSSENPIDEIQTVFNLIFDGIKGSSLPFHLNEKIYYQSEIENNPYIRIIPFRYTTTINRVLKRFNKIDKNELLDLGLPCIKNCNFNQFEKKYILFHLLQFSDGQIRLFDNQTMVLFPLKDQATENYLRTFLAPYLRLTEQERVEEFLLDRNYKDIHLESNDSSVIPFWVAHINDSDLENKRDFNLYKSDVIYLRSSDQNVIRERILRKILFELDLDTPLAQFYEIAEEEQKKILQIHRPNPLTSSNIDLSSSITLEELYNFTLNRPWMRSLSAIVRRLMSLKIERESTIQKILKIWVSHKPKRVNSVAKKALLSEGSGLREPTTQQNISTNIGFEKDLGSISRQRGEFPEITIILKNDRVFKDFLYFQRRNTIKIDQDGIPLNYRAGYKPLNRDPQMIPVWTLPGQPEIMNSIDHLINKSELMIAIYSFIIDNTKIISSIINAAENAIPNIKFMTTLRRGHLTSQDEENIDVNGHLQQLKTLQVEGIEIRSRIDCHAKLILSEKGAIISSANFVKTSLTGNPEFGFMIFNLDLMSQTATFLQRLWDNPHYKAIYRPGVSLGHRTGGVSTHQPPKRYDLFDSQTRKTAGEIRKLKVPHLLWTFQNQTLLSETLCEMINNAKRTIDFFSWIIKDNESYSVGRAILQAIKRGVKIRGFARAMNHRLDHLTGCNQLIQKAMEQKSSQLQQQVIVRGDARNHSKGIIIDSKEAAIFSANFDPLGMERGIEIGIYSNQGSFVKEVQNWFNFLFENGSHELQPDITASQYIQAYIRPNQLVPKIYRINNIIITMYHSETILLDNSPQDIHKMGESLKSQPLRYHFDKVQKILALCSNICYVQAGEGEDGIFIIEDIVWADKTPSKFLNLRDKLPPSYIESGKITILKPRKKRPNRNENRS